MKLDLGSFLFNLNIIGGGATPSWGTALGQGENHRLSFENMNEILPALIYNSRHNVTEYYCPLGKGGQSLDYEMILASTFKKVYVNGVLIPDAEYILVVVKEVGERAHKGRFTLKYNKKIEHNDNPINERCLSLIKNQFQLADDAGWFINEINIKNQDQLHFTAYFVDKNKSVDYNSIADRRTALLYHIDNDNVVGAKKGKPSKDVIQKIYFGAPGTGKSHKIKEETNNSTNKTIVTFHPDSDYTTFVGAYKPTKDKEGKITYGFVPQAFAKAYVAAWEMLLKGKTDSYYLIIEEINRGNCAQIFGDVFQLLDRADDGFSEYVIDVDDDFAQYLEGALGECAGYQEEIVRLMSKSAIVGDFSYSKIALPYNLIIRATMNTSDQSLFPMDSAFKRRWEWEFVPINSSEVRLAKIVVGDKEYSWSDFIEKINKKIIDTCKSEDKQLGAFFIKVSKEKVSVIDWKLFRSKVMSFLWFDVYKDLYESDENTVFRTLDKDNQENKAGTEFSFGKLFDGDEGAQIALLQEFMKYNGVKLFGEE